MEREALTSSAILRGFPWHLSKAFVVAIFPHKHHEEVSEGNSLSRLCGVRQNKEYCYSRHFCVLRLSQYEGLHSCFEKEKQPMCHILLAMYTVWCPTVLHTLSFLKSHSHKQLIIMFNVLAQVLLFCWMRVNSHKERDSPSILEVLVHIHITYTHIQPHLFHLGKN